MPTEIQGTAELSKECKTRVTRTGQVSSKFEENKTAIVFANSALN